MFVRLFLLISAFVRFDVFAVPLSPCPLNFHYEYDGHQWIGVANIPAQVYNSFRTNRITTVIVLILNDQLPDNRNFGSLNLYQTMTETYANIALRRPIKYRINFPIRSWTPALLEINVNNYRICTNQMQQPNMFGMFTRIQLQHSFYLPTLEINEATTTTTKAPLLPNYHRVLAVPNVVSPLQPSSMSDDASDGETPKKNILQIGTISPSAGELSCGKFDEQYLKTHLIKGGDKIGRGTWPWLVAIYRKDVNGVTFECTGNMLTNRIVLTAAHCFRLYTKQTQIQPKQVLLAFGKYNLREWSEKDIVLSDAERFILHPDYMAKDPIVTYDADIAVVVTKIFVEFSAIIRPICLWPAESKSQIENANDIVGLVGTLVGWGQANDKQDANLPRKLNMPVVKKNVCFPSTRANQHEFNKRVFCAGSATGNGPCNGDSGSGLAIWQNGAWFLRGIVSAAIGDPILNRCELNTYVIFTDIIKFRPWIDSFLNI